MGSDQRKKTLQQTPDRSRLHRLATQEYKTDRQTQNKAAAAWNLDLDKMGDEIDSFDVDFNTDASVILKLPTEESSEDFDEDWGVRSYSYTTSYISTEFECVYMCVCVCVCVRHAVCNHRRTLTL